MSNSKLFAIKSLSKLEGNIFIILTLLEDNNKDLIKKLNTLIDKIQMQIDFIEKNNYLSERELNKLEEEVLNALSEAITIIKNKNTWR